MDRQLLERMVGAGVLLIALILVVPAVLDGEGDQPARDDGTDQAAGTMRTHTIRLDRPPKRPPVATEVAKSAPVPAQETAKPAPRDKPAARSSAPVAPPPKKSESAQAPVKSVTANAATARVADTAPAIDRGWAVQLGSFAQQANARRLAQEVGGKGFPTYLVPLRRSGRTLYRVRVGPRETRGEAEELAG
ncbi:MAG: SPOR domain-containing protein, partial [Gammaproteobacteria bacterium]|nr:SPOR domain-containing protein [Gammaproteobacteria bacterium]